MTPAPCAIHTPLTLFPAITSAFRKRWITNVKDSKQGGELIGGGHARCGDSLCVTCRKQMPRCWDTVCSICGDTSCYSHSHSDGTSWFCEKCAKAQTLVPNAFVHDEKGNHWSDARCKSFREENPNLIMNGDQWIIDPNDKENQLHLDPDVLGTAVAARARGVEVEG